MSAPITFIVDGLQVRLSSHTLIDKQSVLSAVFIGHQLTSPQATTEEIADVHVHLVSTDTNLGLAETTEIEMIADE